jgi:leucyl aminopeptidase (aminopeptidase T)
MNRITQRYIPQTERSFTIIAFPVPEIGEPFEDIFRETVRVNTLDSEQYSRIQEKLISALDQGTKVRIKGRGGNNRIDVACLRSRIPCYKTLSLKTVAGM